MEHTLLSKEVLTSQQTCRICLNYSTNLKCILNSFYGHTEYIEMYSICSGLVLSNDTISMFDATTNICSECDKKLISSFDFKKLMIQSEEVLLAYQTDCKNGMSQVKFENCENDDEQNLCTILDDLQKVEKLEVDGEMFTVTHEEHLLQDGEESSLVIEKLLNSDDSNVSADEYVEEYHDSKDPEDPDTALNFACEYCGKTYKKKSTLKAHMSKNHTENLEEEYLDETDHRKELLKLKKSELNKKRYLCPHCGKMALSSHIKLCVPLEGGVIDGKPFACDQCGLKYKTSNSLTKHKRKHTDDRRYQCSYCKECFLHWASRRNHVYLKHTGERKYACSYCSETFYQRGKYNVHLRRHTGSLPFSCDVCQKRFITNVALKGHMICHTNEKNFPCEICKKPFGRKKSLMTHMKIHTGEKNYVCPVCGKAFIQNHVLRSHMKSHPGANLPPPGTVVSQKVLNNKEHFSYPSNMFFPHYNS